MIMAVIIAESLESMMSLTYFNNKDQPVSVENSIAEHDAWLSEGSEYDKRNYDDPNHPTKNQANMLLMKYSEFSSSYF